MAKFFFSRVFLFLNLALCAHCSAPNKTDGLAIKKQPLARGAVTSLRPNILLISLDTLRADALGLYGHSEDLSPNLDALGQESLVFKNAYSQAPWTTPSHMSLLTGLYPSNHGVMGSWSDFKDAQSGKGCYRILSPEIPTLAETLQGLGYATHAITGGGTMAGSLGFSRGFETYREGPRKLSAGVIDEALGFLRNSARERPVFLFLHSFEVHAAYTRSLRLEGTVSQDKINAHDLALHKAGPDAAIDTQKEFLQSQGLWNKEVTRSLYDGGVAHVDHMLGRLFSGMRDSGLWEHTLIIVTSDHGEAFGEHDPTKFYDAHCTTLYEELMHVPLLIRAPMFEKSAKGVSDRIVELVDVIPTLFDFLGHQAALPMDGESLRSAWQNDFSSSAKTRSHSDLALSESVCSGGEWKSVRSPRQTQILIADHTSGSARRMDDWHNIRRRECYDRTEDRKETKNLWPPGALEPLAPCAKAASTLATLRMRLGGRNFAPGPCADLGDEVFDELRALGYIE